MAKASVAITVNNQMKSGLESAKKDLTSFEQVASKVGDTLKSAFTVTAVIAGINQLAQSAKQCVTEFSAVDQANRQLEAIWKNVGDATGYTSQQLLDYADSIEKVTYFEAESVQSAAQLLASTQKLTKEGFQKALDASVDLAAALGTDVSNAAQTLSQALQDPEAGLTRLRRVGITFTDSEKEMIKALADAGEEFKAQEVILEKVESKYKGIAEAVANTPTNTLTQISNTLGTIKEGLGEGIVYALEPAFNFILSSLRKIENWVNKYNAKAANDRDVYDISEGADLSKYTAAELAQIKSGINLSEIPYYSFETDASTIAYREIEQELRKRAAESTSWFSTEKNTTPSTGAVTIIPLTSSTPTIEPVIEPVVEKTVNEALNSLTEFLSSYYKAPELSGMELYQSVINQASALYGQIQSNAIDLEGLDREQILSQLESVVSDFSQKADEFIALNTTTVKDTSIVSSFLNSLDTSILQKKDQFDIEAASRINELYADVVIMLENSGVELSSYINQTEGMWDNLNTEQKNALNTAVEAIQKETEEKKKAYERAKNFLTQLGDQFANIVTSNLNISATTEQSQNFGSGVISSFVDNMGEAGEVAGKLAKNMANMGPILGAIATALEYIFEGLNEIIGTELDKQIEYGLEPLREIGRVIGEIILPLMEALSPQLEIIQDISKMLFNAIGSVLQPIFEMISKIVSALTPLFEILVPIMELIAEVLQAIGVIIESILMPAFEAIGNVLGTIIKPIIESIGTVLEILSPVLKVFAKIIVTITGTFQYIGQVLMHWVATICNWLAGLSIFGWHPFSGLAMDDPGSPGSYSSYIQSKWASIDEAFSGASSLTESDTSSSTSTSVSSAGYMGATQVTINIYQQAPVVGDAGMREFARMIKSEFDELSYYGVTT